jgi:hypothetical protein
MLTGDKSLAIIAWLTACHADQREREVQEADQPRALWPARRIRIPVNIRVEPYLRHLRRGSAARRQERWWWLTSFALTRWR